MTSKIPERFNLFEHLENDNEFIKCKSQNTGEFVKKQQYKKATRVWRFNSFSGQRWKLDDNKKLENKEGVWKSDDLWSFKPKDNDLIYIENTSKTKVLGATNYVEVNLEDFEEGKAHQLWKKGELDAEDYFTLEKFEKIGVPKVLTAISESSLEIKGNISMRWTLLVEYLPCCFFTHRSSNSKESLW